MFNNSATRNTRSLNSLVRTAEQQSKRQRRRTTLIICCWNSLRLLVTDINTPAFTGNMYMIMNHLLRNTRGRHGDSQHGADFFVLFLFLYLHLINGKKGREVVPFQSNDYMHHFSVSTHPFESTWKSWRGRICSHMPRLNDSRTQKGSKKQTISSHLFTQPIKSCLEMAFVLTRFDHSEKIFSGRGVVESHCSGDPH